MAIPRVNLNLDPSGYAGPMVPRLGGPAPISPFGIDSRVFDMLQRNMLMKERLAQAQLDLMRNQLQGSREERARAPLREKELMREQERMAALQENRVSRAERLKKQEESYAAQKMAQTLWSVTRTCSLAARRPLSKVARQRSGCSWVASLE